MLRGRASDGDERFVADLAHALSIPLIIRHADIGSAAVRTRRSTQEAARIERRQFLERCAVEVGADAIALAHTADDRVETVLLNVFRGTGVRGLAAMPWRDGKIVRPLLAVTRAMTGAYCRRAAISPRLDASNRSVHYRRNWLRHELIPMVEARINPQVKKAILDLADMASAETAYLDAECTRAIEQMARPNASGGLDIRSEDYCRIAPALRTHLIRGLIARLAGSDADITRRDVVRIDNALLTGHKASWMLAGRVVVTTGPQLTIQPIAWPAEPVPFEVTLPNDGDTAVPGRRGTVRVALETLDSIPQGEGRRPRRPGYVVHVPVEAVDPPLVLRSVRDGDRMQPLGMTGHKKIRDHLRDAGIPPIVRPKALVVCDRRGILWVPGLAADERARIKSVPTVVYRIELLTEPEQTT